VRIRPPLPREPPLREPALLVSASADGRPAVSVIRPSRSVADPAAAAEPTADVFSFDGVFGEAATQRDVYEAAAAPQVAACLHGFNSTVFCYGPSGSGKSHTCYGPAHELPPAGRRATAAWATSDAAGLIPRAAQQLFESIASGGRGRFVVRVSFLQLYRESIYDLLSPSGRPLALREDPRAGVFVEGIFLLHESVAYVRREQ